MQEYENDIKKVRQALIQSPELPLAGDDLQTALKVLDTSEELYRLVRDHVFRDGDDVMHYNPDPCTE